MMSKPNILFAGCSFTADSGFSDNKRSLYHWPELVCKHFNASMTNIAVGGCPNDEIFYRASESVYRNPVNLVIVMWSDIARHWVYFSENNVDDFTICNYGQTSGFQSKDSSVNTYTKLHYAYFDNQYIKLKHWLLHTLTLAATLKSLNIPYVFLRGFSNYIEDFRNIEYSPDTGFSNVSAAAKKLLDFDCRPDYYILRKLTDIQMLINRVSNLSWINFTTPSFNDIAFDVACDQKHPGSESNKLIAQQIIDFCQEQHFIVS